MELASSVILDWNRGLVIDGIPFPFYIGENAEVVPGGGQALTEVHLRLLVWGNVLTIDPDGKRKVSDRELGDVGEWARALVREGLHERLPWLTHSPDPAADPTKEGEA